MIRKLAGHRVEVLSIGSIRGEWKAWLTLNSGSSDQAAEVIGNAQDCVLISREHSRIRTVQAGDGDLLLPAQ